MTATVGRQLMNIGRQLMNVGGRLPNVVRILAPFPFERSVAQKVLKLKKFGKISDSRDNILALKLSSGVS